MLLWRSVSRQGSPSPERRSTQCYYCSQGSGRRAGGSARDWGWMRRWGSRREWRTQGRRDTLIMSWPWDDAHKSNLSHDVVCNYDDQNLTTGLCAHGITLAFTSWCSCALCGRCSGSWWLCCHWCRARFHHADAIPLMVTLSLVSRSVSPRRRNTKCRVLSFWIL